MILNTLSVTYNTKPTSVLLNNLRYILHVSVNAFSPSFCVCAIATWRT